MRCIACLVIVASILSVNAYAGHSNTSSCQYSELYKKEGWFVPGREGAKSTRARTAVSGKMDIYFTVLQPARRESTIQVYRCSREHIGRLEIEDITMGIGYISSFDVGGRVFAYSLTYGVNATDIGTQVPVAAVWSVKFYELDGSGRFTLRRSERNRIVPELVPGWVKRAEAREKTQEMRTSSK